MPYKIVKDSSGKWCVHNKDTGESKGCSDSRGMAIQHMRALYAHETKKEFDSDEVKELIEKSIEESDQDVKDFYASGEFVSYPSPMSPTSFDELEKIEAAREIEYETSSLTSKYMTLFSNIMYSYGIDDKASAIEGLTSEFIDRLKSLPAEESEDKEQHAQVRSKSFGESVKRVVESIFGLKAKDQESEGDFMIWKEANGEYVWVSRYSNKFRDEDNKPSPEIICEAAHKKFVESVEKGLVDPPELWIWHVPEWKIGTAQWVEYDDSGFAIAGGVFDKDKQDVAEWLSKQKNILTSHGMPKSSVKRDPNDSTIITEYITREISPLPQWAAANKMTGFVAVEKSNEEQEKSTMAIPDKKRTALIKEWGATPELLDRIEAMNKKDAEKATLEGIESKENDQAETPPTETTPPAETAPVAEVTPAEETPVDNTQENTPAEVVKSETSQDYPTREEIAHAVAEVLNPLAETLTAAVGRISEMESAMKALESQFAEIKERDEERIAKAASGSSTASIAAMINARSVVGQHATEVKKGENLSKSKPKETTAPKDTRFIGAPFIANMIGANGALEDDED